MLKKIFWLALIIAGLQAQEIEGYYLTHVNEKGKQSIVEIFKHNGKYFAYGFATTDGSPSIDEKNPDEKLRGRKMSGVVFVWNLVQDKKEWSGGKIYNYASGKTYDASAWFDKKGDLIVKASVWGFGKEFVWKKMSEKEVEQYLGTKPSMEKVIESIPQK